MLTGMLTRFKLGMLFACGIMGASFAEASSSKDMVETWIAIGIALAITGAIIPSPKAWQSTESVTRRLIFFLTTGAFGACISRGIHALHSEHPGSATTWFVFAAGALAAFAAVKDD